MSDSIVENILRHKKIIPVVVALAAIAAYVIPANSLALGAITGSGNVVQTQTQSNSISATNTGKYGGAFADFNFQLNDGSNSAVVSISDPGKIKDSGNVLQAITQSNSISADNSGDSGTASASFNTQVNSASNDASVNVSNDPSGGSWHHHHHSGDQIKDSGNVVQSIDQSNSISASNSGDSGTATADHNTQVNDAHNHADVSVSNDPSGGSYHHSGDKIKDSGNVVQSIKQSNSISASNSGDHGTASASHNTEVNSASNDAHVSISNH